MAIERRRRLIAATTVVVAVLGIGGCQRSRRTSPSTTTTARSAGSATTVPLAAAHGITVEQYVTRFSHDPDNDRTTLSNNGFVNADFDPKSSTIVLFTLRFQGRDGAAEALSTFVNATRSRKDHATFTVDGVDGASGVRWLEQGRSSGDVTIEQVLFVRETRLVIVEATLPAGTTTTDDIRAAARSAA